MLKQTVVLFSIVFSLSLLFSGCETSRAPSSSFRSKSSRPRVVVTSKIKAERAWLEKVYLESNELLVSLKSGASHRLTWNQLRRRLSSRRTRQAFSRKVIQSAGLVIEFFEKRANRLISLYNVSFKWRGTALPSSKRFIKRGNSYLPPEEFSMWRHCEIYVEKANPGLDLELVSAYQSPAYQLIAFAETSRHLRKALTLESPPYFSGHQSASPYISIRIRKKLSGRSLWSGINRECGKYGFSPVYSTRNQTERHYRFIGIKRLYKGILGSERLPPHFANLFLMAMYRTGFFPSPRGLRVIFALSEKESGIRWDPPIGKKKKRVLRRRFNRFLARTKKGVTGMLVKALLSHKQLLEKKRLASRLQKLTTPRAITTEYDIYLWSQRAYRFYLGVIKRHNRMVGVGKWFLDFNALGGKLNYEPQSFGLWQINVNHLVEKLNHDSRFRKKYAPLFSGRVVNRHRLVSALSGYENRLPRVKTLSLIIEAVLYPRYKNHLNGSEYDLMFFAAENLTGELSTYRAAIQKELNRRLNARQTQDGDLSIFFPYSTRINWNKRSNTQKSLLHLMDRHKRRFSSYRQRKREMKILCQASSKTELLASELYRFLMKNRMGQRLFPTIKSALYNQTPTRYVNQVMKFARRYPLITDN